MLRRQRDLGDSLERAIAAKVIAGLRARGGLQRAVERGIIEPRFIEFDPATTIDPVAAIREFGASLAQAIRKRPTSLAHLEMKAIELLGQDALGTSPAIGSAAPEDRAIVFTDLEGFTAFTLAEGDDTAGRLLDGHYRAVGGIVKSRGGTVVKRLGDGHLLSFPTSRAAVIATIELVEASPGSLSLRAGAHAGEVMIAGDNLLGRVVSVASRVADVAFGGEALVTGQVRRPAGSVPGIGFEPVPPRELEGLEDGRPLWLLRRE